MYSQLANSSQFTSSDIPFKIVLSPPVGAPLEYPSLVNSGVKVDFYLVQDSRAKSFLVRFSTSPTGEERSLSIDVNTDVLVEVSGIFPLELSPERGTIKYIIRWISGTGELERVLGEEEFFIEDI